MDDSLTGHYSPSYSNIKKPFKRSFLLTLFTLAYLSGNLVLQQCSHLPSGLNLIVFAVFIILCLCTRFICKQEISQYAFVIGLLIVGFYLGFSRAWIQADNYLNSSAPADLMSEDKIIPACVSSLPQLKGETLRFIIEPLADVETNLKRIRVSASHKYNSLSDIQAGSCWGFHLRLKTTRGLRNKHGFDYELWLYQQSVGATTYLRGSPELLEQNAYPWLRIRARLAEQIKNLLPQGSTVTPLILGLTLGIRDEMTTEQWTVLQKTGTSHLLAISGLHIGIAALFGFYLGKCFWLLLTTLGRSRSFVHRITPLRFGLLLGIIFAIFYAALAGFSVPTQRACIMLVVATLVMFGSKRVAISSVLSIALLIVLSVDPVASLSSGTWLSFLAVGVLVFFTRRDKSLLPQSKKIINQATRKILMVGRLQFLLVMLLSVPVALSFSQVSIIAPVVNFILIPLFSFTVVPILLLAILLLPISVDVASSILNFEHQWLEFIWTILEWSSALPLSSSEIQINFWQSLLLLILLLPMLLPKGVISRGYTSILILPLLFGFANRGGQADLLTMKVYDVGQGLAVLLQTKEHRLLYDTGPAFRSGGSAAEWVLIPDFKTEHIQQLDALVISHSDNDHAGGVDRLVEDLNPQQIFSPANDPVKNSEACVAAKSWIWDGVSFEFLYPFTHTHSSNNNNYSCVLKVSVAGHSILLTGDIETSAEYVILAQYAELKSDVVFAPHHGSRSSSTQEFINAVQAEHVIFASGFANRWGFPKQDVTQRWQASGARTYNIANTGQIEFVINKDKSLKSKVWIAQECRYWHQDCE